MIRNIRVDFHHTDIPARFVLEKKFKSHWLDLTRSVIFKKIDTDTYGFREALLARSLSLMRGVVIFDHENSQVVVKGFFNWINYARGSAIAEFAAQSWSRKYIPAGKG